MNKQTTLELSYFSDRAAYGKLYPQAAYTQDQCRALFKTVRGTGRWTCTREVGHGGPHCAHSSSGNALAVLVQA